MSDVSDDFDEDDGVQLGDYDGERNEKEERNGYGKATLPNGDTYEGQYLNGKRHGQGTYRFKNGARYTGEYDNAKKHGQGTFTYPDGSRYEGSWVDDQRNGHGVYRYANGDTFEGDWYEHKRHGYGIYTYATTGTSYRGMWEAGQKKGSGDIVNADHKFSGYFDEDIPKGPGKYRFEIGCELHGEYRTEEELQQPANEDDEVILITRPKWITNGRITASN